MNSPDWIAVNRCIESFEQARAKSDQVDLADFLPFGPMNLRLAVLTELVRVDLEYAWRAGSERAADIESYLRRFPELVEHAEGVRQIAWEEHRQRGSAAVRLRRGNVAKSSFSHLCDSGRRTKLFLEESGSELGQGAREKSSTTHGTIRQKFPAIGSRFLGFRLLDLLGEGAFSRVYLAQQGPLADRLIALKVVAEMFGESQTLAVLQHTNIVPIYSVHRQDGFEAICMPYLGSTTLQDLVDSLESSPSLPTSAAALESIQWTARSRRIEARTMAQSIGSGSTIRVEREATILDDEALVRLAHQRDRGDGSFVHEQLRDKSYVDAVLWVGARLAEGLAHAHERGVLHLDLKPANVLLRDDGEPMLLDFNLANSAGAGVGSTDSRIGGTIPYMSPEHLEAFRSRRSIDDPRADVFSLGVLLYQLLTGRLPFPSPAGEENSWIDQVIAERRLAPASIRGVHRMASPAVESIIGRCLAFSPADRYRNARELAEDLQRQFEQRPLQFAPDPSPRERLSKWSHRHPRWTSGSAVAALAMTCGLALGGALWERGRRLERIEARQQTVDFRRDLQTVRYLLGAPNATIDELERGAELCRRNLTTYLEPSLTGEVRVHRIASLDAAIRAELAEQLYLLVRASVQRWGLSAANAPETPATVDEWLAWNAAAQQLSDPNAVPQAFLWQQARLLQWKGRNEDARRLLAKIEHTPPTLNQDLYLTSSELLAQQRCREAMPLLERLLESEPSHFWGQMALGHCLAGVGRDRDAVHRFDLAALLEPDASWPYFQRGLARLRLGQDAAAAKDLSAAVDRRSEWWEALLMRALARQRLRRWDDAVSDLSAALDAGAPKIRVYCLRCRLFRQCGRMEEAKRDLELGMQGQPSDELSWVARGLALLPTDPEKALACFDAALADHPQCRSALKNRAHVLAENLQRPEAAVETLRRALRAFPDDVGVRTSLALVSARLGRRETAIQLAEECLRSQPDRATLYQIAGVFAAASVHHAPDGERAINVLAAAVHEGVDAKLLATDHGLDPIRNHPRFSGLLAASTSKEPKRHGLASSGASLLGRQIEEQSP